MRKSFPDMAIASPIQAYTRAGTRPTRSGGGHIVSSFSYEDLLGGFQLCEQKGIPVLAGRVMRDATRQLWGHLSDRRLDRAA